MAKTFSLSLGFLASVVVTGIPARAAITTAQTVAQPQPQLTAQAELAQTLFQIIAQNTAPASSTLALEDLPPGFTALPPELSASLASRLQALNAQLPTGNLKPENFFAFVNPKSFQIVLGFTGQLPNETQRVEFDTSLKQLQQPDVQKRTLSLLQEKLKTFGEVKVTEYRGMPELNNLADTSTGFTIALEMRGQPLRLDLATFRRNEIGAFTGVIYTNGETPLIAVGDVARKLDGRLAQVPR
jgi:hypothetical protein